MPSRAVEAGAPRPDDAAPAPGPARTPAPGIVAVRRSTLRLLATIVRDPLAAIPRASFTERMVVTENAGRRRAYLSDPALIHEVIVRQADHLAKSEETKRVLGAALGDGLLTADGADWRWQRRALSPAFAHDKLAAMLPAMIAAAEATRDRLRALPAGSVVDVGRETMRTTFAVILDTMLSGREGIDAVGVERGVDDFLAATTWMFALAILRAPRWLPHPGKRRAAAATRIMRATVTARIASRRAAGGGSADLIGLLLAASDPDTGRSLDDDEVADNILTFVTAGHETTAVALAWALALLADHPDCAERLRAEVDAATGGGPVLPQHVAGLAYVRQVVNEAMRLYPPAPMIARAVVRDLVVEGVALPAGSVVFVPVYAVHRHRALWERPDTFDPDRFAPRHARHRFAFLPFGAGPRTCIGSAFAVSEAVAILAVLMQRLGFERAAPALPLPMMRVTLRPRHPLLMRVAPR